MAFTYWVKLEAKNCAQVLHQLCISNIFPMGKANKWNYFFFKTKRLASIAHKEKKLTYVMVD
jgi:hypothetical protein